MDPAYLASTAALDSDHPSVRDFARRHCDGANDERERARRLFYAVRDGIRYNPFGTPPTLEDMKASTTLARGESFCIPKAMLLTASARAVGIPARLGFADVRNHLTSDRLRAIMKSDLFVFHGYTELWLGGRWVKATPTFNLSLCQKTGVRTLEFDGEHDSLLQPFDNAGGRHMEYVRDRGTFADLDLPRILEAWIEAYGSDFGSTMSGATRSHDAAEFEREAKAESKA
ncbi:MAG: transglutaminase family protein [Polyangiales bacterium]